jgi:hypothetical protein
VRQVCSASVSWISPPRPGGVAEHVEDRARQHVAADDREVRRRLVAGVGFSTRSVMRYSPGSVGHPVHVGDAVEVDLVLGDLHQRDDGTAGALVRLDHPLEEVGVRVDDVVAEQDGEALVADVLGAHQHRVPEPERLGWRTLWIVASSASPRTIASSSSLPLASSAASRSSRRSKWSSIAALPAR